jgi:hypothetical protein
MRGGASGSHNGYYWKTFPTANGVRWSVYENANDREDDQNRLKVGYASSEQRGETACIRWINNGGPVIGLN